MVLQMTTVRSGRLVSVILPTYHRAALLPRSIGSVLDQTDGDLELIVVDDGSEDDTETVVAAIDDPRVRYVKLPRNRGLPGARNVGVAEARGAYLAFQDSDDVWHREKLARQRAFLDAHPDAGVAYCDMRRVLADGRTFYHRSPTIVRGRLVAPETRYWQSYMLAMQPVLMRRECLVEELFDARMVGLEDLDLHLRVSRRFEYAHLYEPLVDYHETSDGLTTNRRAELTARRQLLAKFARALTTTDPLFGLKETLDVLLRRSLLPIVAQHLTPL